MNNMAAEVKSALGVLLGLRLSLSSYSGLKVFGFGQTQRRGDGMVAKYSLQVQCPWRLVRNERLICGSFDRFLREDGSYSDDDDWDPFDGNLLDVILMRLFENVRTVRTRMPLENKTGDLVVTGVVEVDDFGGFTLRLSPDYALSVFPAGSTGEYWRLFKPGIETSHFVVEA
jgi:hypothetical protein